MRFVSILLLFLAYGTASAQEIANFTQFFVNPYVINPSFAGIEGSSGLYLTYRMQWVDFDGGPTIGNLSYHTGIKNNLGFGVNLSNDQRGVLNTSSGLLSLSYAARLGNNSYLRFGASAGAASNGLDFATITNPNDPALFNALENNVFIIGNAGLSLHVKSFHIGASMPDLFEPQLVDSIKSDNFSFSNLKPTERFIITASNRFYFGNDQHVFEPYLVYRMNKSLPSQLEAAAIVHLNHAFWFGGTYKQDFGISGAVGFKKPEKFGIGYSYTFKNLGVNQIQSPTHEVTFSLLLGERRPRRQKYSFVNTLLEEEIPVTQAPTGETPQVFCSIDEPVLTDLKVDGSSLKYYDSPDSKTPLNTSESLTDGAIFYISQTQNEMESEERLSVSIEINDPEAPRVNQAQSFSSDDSPKVMDLEAPIDQIIWYPEADGGVAYNSELPLIEKTYYASQVVEGCESIERTAVQVEITEPEIIPDTTITKPKDEIKQQTSDSTVVVKRGNHLLELPVGVYVVIGVFSQYDNAEKYSDQVFMLGYHDTQFGYITERGFWYVYMHKSKDGVKAREIRDRMRKLRRFSDGWVLEVR